MFFLDYVSSLMFQNIDIKGTETFLIEELKMRI
jgi:hypothetical protein